jgi:hypothetical protein
MVPPLAERHFPIAALSHADAALDGAHEAVADVAVEAQRGGQLDRPVVRAHAQVLVDAVRVDQLAGIQPVQRIPDALELAERLHQLRAVHQGQELGARLAVTMLAR